MRGAFLPSCRQRWAVAVHSGALPRHAGAAQQRLVEMTADDLKSERRAVLIASSRQGDRRLTGGVVNAGIIDELLQANLIGAERVELGDRRVEPGGDRHHHEIDGLKKLLHVAPQVPARNGGAAVVEARESPSALEEPTEYRSVILLSGGIG